ncbi:MAG: molybdopterin-dependent oxidoreductase [Actinomycetota bacterium]|nr:molybdopterin-dependent oxidoreductase [Actinomycetota bacterium]
METARSFCRVCHAACPIDVDIEAGRVVAIRGVREDPLFEGYTCIKGRQLPDQMHHPDRLRFALRRVQGAQFEPVASATALDEIADRLRATIERHGPGSVAVYTGTGAYQNSTSVPTARAFLRGVGSRSFYTSLTIDQPAKATAPARAGDWEAGFHEFTGADVLMAVGYNPMVSGYGPATGLQGTNPFTVMRRAKQRGMHLVVIDPRRTELAEFADVFLQLRPGEDPTLLAGIINVILSEGLHDAEFCARWVANLDALADGVRPFEIGYVADRCGVDADDIVAAARLFAAGPRGCAGTGTGPSMAPHSSLTEHLVIALNVVCARVNQPGDTIGTPRFLLPENPRRAQVVAPRDARTGRPHRVRGLRGYAGEMVTSALADEILMPGEGQVRALIVSGGNPALAWPDQAHTMRALRDLELLVVLDHRMTPTAEAADYVIAPRLSLERADVPHLMDMWFSAPYSNYTDAVIAASGDVLTEWEVFAGLARRLSTPMHLPGGDLMEIPEPDDHDVIGLAYAHARMPISAMREARGVVHADRAAVAAPADPGCDARFALGDDDVIAEIADVRAETTAGQVLTGADADAYPFRLVSRRLKTALNSLGRELPGLAKATTNAAYMHPDDLHEIGVAAEDLIEISSPHASLIAVAAAAPDVRRGVVSMAHGWGDATGEDAKVRDIGAPTNRLVTTAHGYDAITGMAVQSAIPVSVTAYVADRA